MMPIESSRGTFVMIAAACFVIIVAGIQAAQALIVPFLLSAFIACICLPPMNWLIQHKILPIWAVFIVILGLITGGFLLAAFAGASVADFSQNLPLYQEGMKIQIAEFVVWLSGFGIIIPNSTILDHFDPSAAMGMAGSLLAGLGNVLANTFFILLTVIFLMFEAIALPHKWAVMGEHAPATHAVNTFLKSVNKYLVIKTLVSLATGAAVTTWLTIMGVDYPILWGIISFLFNFVPNIGSIIAAVPALMLTLVQLGPDAVLYVGLGYMVINVLMGNVIEPRFMGKGLGLSTLVVFLSLVFWGWGLGLVGMLLSVPLTMIVKIALESNEKTQWIAVLIGPDIEPDTGPEATNTTS